MQSIPLLPLHPGPLWPWVVTPDRILSMGKIEPSDFWMVYKQMSYTELLEIPIFGHLTVFKEITDITWIVNDTYQYLEPFNRIQINEQSWIV